MTRRIGKRTRAAAIHCLEQCASDRIGGVASTCTHHVYDGHVSDIASDAWHAVYRAVGASMPDKYLEAAALLRDGWNPGDPVRR